MNNIALIEKHLIVNNEYEATIINQILEMMKRDIEVLYMNERSGQNMTSQRAEELAEEIKINICDYVMSFDDTNAGEILLFLSKLPAIANDMCLDIENNIDEINGITQISARDKVDSYMKQVFECGYETLYGELNDKQIGVNMYYQCEKFIDALVLEFKQNVSPMIDKDNLVFDDLIYYRRLLINILNNNENYEFIECNDCKRDDCTYTLCSVLPKVKYHNETHANLTKQIQLLNQLINGDGITEKQFNNLGNNKHDEMIKRFVNIANNPSINEHKKIEFVGHPKIFSIISAERFEKILKRRYTGEAYEKDKDIYYMLSVGIEPREVFNGDNLLKNIKDIHEAYSGEQNIN